MHVAYAYGCYHNQCTDHKSFAKRNISHQFKSLINSLTIDYLRSTNIFFYCRFRVWAGEIFVWGAPQKLHNLQHKNCNINAILITFRTF